MIHFITNLNKIDWTIECFITTSDSQLNEIMNSLKKLDCSNYTLDRAYQILFNSYDSGFAYSNLKKRTSIMVINNSTSLEEFINTYNHEKNHIEMHICEKLNIDPYGEIASDLSGCLAQKLFNEILINIQ